MDQVEIWGLGLMGLSLAAGLLQANTGLAVYGVDANPAAEAYARRQGVRIGRAPHPRWVVVAVPPQAVADVLSAATPRLAPGTVVTDITSVKHHVLPALAALPGHLEVASSHPMTGRERGGGINFQPDLYRDRVWALIPVPGRPSPEGPLRALVEPLGARVVTLPAARHDRLAARTSHLPYVSALALTNLAREDRDTEHLMGPGFLGATRTAAAPPELWSEILDANREELLAALHDYVAELTTWEAALSSLPIDQLRTRIQAIQAVRMGWPATPTAASPAPIGAGR